MGTCVNCGAINPDQDRFCGQCGANLNPDLKSIQEMVQQLLDSRYRNLEVVDVQTTQKIVTRLTDWAKLFAFAVGIPVGLILFVLTVLGLKSYNDFNSIVDRGKSDISGQVTAAHNQLVKLQADGASLNKEYADLRARLRDNEALADQVSQLNKKVEILGERLGFSPSSDLTPSLKNKISQSFSRFSAYLRTIGYQSGNSEIGLSTTNLQAGAIAYFDPAKNEMKVSPGYLNNSSIIYHEYMRHVLIPDLGSRSLADTDWPYVSIYGALAAYYPCSYAGSPTALALAGGGGWDLTKHAAFSLISPTFMGADQRGAEVWGSAFWQIRQILGRDPADKLLYKTWTTSTQSDVDERGGAKFARKLVDGAPAAERARIQSVFTSRGMYL